MNKEERNLRSIFLFLVIIVLIVVFGNYLINKNKNNEQETKQEKPIVKNVKIDLDKDYIYFTNEEDLSKELNLFYKDIIININSEDAKKLQKELNDNMHLLKDSIVKIDDIELNEDLIEPNEENIYSAKVINYGFEETSKYLSLIVNKYTFYAVEKDDNEQEYEYYVFDLSNGKLLTNHDIMKKENITDQAIRSKIREYLSNDSNADIDRTLANNYYLTVKSNGKIIVNFVVISNELSYNVSMEMD